MALNVAEISRKKYGRRPDERGPAREELISKASSKIAPKKKNQVGQLLFILTTLREILIKCPEMGHWSLNRVILVGIEWHKHCFMNEWGFDQFL